MKKYELTTNTKMAFGRKLFQIKALMSFGDVKKGDLGGFIAMEDNLSQDGDAWVYGDATVCDSARVYGSARVCGSASVYGSAWVYGSARVYGSAMVYGDARVSHLRDWCLFTGFGSELRTTTVFKENGGNIKVACGCFTGTLDEFTEKIKQTHGGNKYAQEYLKIVEVIRIHFDVNNESPEEIQP